MHNLDDYAWYEVGSTRYYNKIQALMQAKKTGLSVRWNMNDQILDNTSGIKNPLQR